MYIVDINREEMFDVYTYLNKLRYDVAFIDLSDMNLTHIPDLTHFISLREFWCNNNRLTCISHINDNLK